MFLWVIALIRMIPPKMEKVSHDQSKETLKLDRHSVSRPFERRAFSCFHKLIRLLYFRRENENFRLCQLTGKNLNDFRLLYCVKATFNQSIIIIINEAKKFTTIFIIKVVLAPPGAAPNQVRTPKRESPSGCTARSLEGIYTFKVKELFNWITFVVK